MCSCLPEFYGDPFRGCRPECVLSSDCPRDKTCIRNKCVDPCPGTCGQNAECTVINHVPTCSCIKGYAGNAFVLCTKIEGICSKEDSTRIHNLSIPVDSLPQNPCNPSPCGPNSQCRQINGQAVCSCVPGFIGSPPTCRPECIISSECSLTKACVNQKCVDPCPGSCGINAKCQVINHNPICSCSERFSGDPFIRCLPIRKQYNSFNYIAPTVSILADVPTIPINPCDPSPCGPSSLCKVTGDSPSCSCLPEFIGAPPNCRPECINNNECSNNLACISQKCRNPCEGVCGENAECRVVSHTPNCVCVSGYIGDPFTRCFAEKKEVPVIVTPCVPSPCGANAICREQNNAGSCSCIPDYTGNPYEGCRPECVLNSDCPSNKACVRNKCIDPCPGTCGINADCQVISHLPSCTCRTGNTGNPFVSCNPIPPADRKFHCYFLN